jgi:hypothetical protein
MRAGWVTLNPTLRRVTSLFHIHIKGQKGDKCNKEGIRRRKRDKDNKENKGLNGKQT